jgi:protein-S-isoprenylcysteine O-methyltransferase Ste14
MHPGGVIIMGLWVAFWLSWLAAAWWSSQPDKSVGLRAEARSRIALIAGGLLFLIPSHGYVGPLRLWSPTIDLFWLCIALMLLGFGFSWWARIRMGRMWSGRITRKPDHHILDTGPFGIVRHPIYTGILTAVIGTLLVKGTVLGVLGAAIILAGLWMKARLEETWLSEELGPAAYRDYQARVPMLVPFGPRGPA